MGIDETLVSFLQSVRTEALRLSGGKQHTFTRNDLIANFRTNFPDGPSVSQVLDLLFFNGLMDAESKSGPQVEGYYVTDLGIEFLRNPSVFTITDGEVIRRQTETIDATAWTGKKLILTDEKVIRQIREQSQDLRERVYATKFESNSDSNDLKSLSDALVKICEMAEPDIGIIERILSHPKFKLYAAILTGVATIRGALGF